MDHEFTRETSTIESPAERSDWRGTPSPWLSCFLVLFFPAGIIYGLMRLVFPRTNDERQFSMRGLILTFALISIVMGTIRWLYLFAQQE